MLRNKQSITEEGLQAFASFEMAAAGCLVRVSRSDTSNFVRYCSAQQARAVAVDPCWFVG